MRQILVGERRGRGALAAIGDIPEMIAEKGVYHDLTMRERAAAWWLQDQQAWGDKCQGGDEWLTSDSGVRYGVSSARGLQHAWATAPATETVVTGQQQAAEERFLPLPYGRGSEKQVLIPQIGLDMTKCRRLTNSRVQPDVDPGIIER